MSIEAEITRLVEAKQALGTYLEEKGVTVPNYALLGDMVALLGNIPLPVGDARIETSTARVDSNGELLIGEAFDERDIHDNLVCVFAYIVAESGSTSVLVLTPTLGQYYNSSMAIDTKSTWDILRLVDVGEVNKECYWMVDPGLYVASLKQDVTVHTIWRK